MNYTPEQARAHLLGLLLGGASPEEAEAWLEERQGQNHDATALSDPYNVRMQEVIDGPATRAS